MVGRLNVTFYESTYAGSLINRCPAESSADPDQLAFEEAN